MNGLTKISTLIMLFYIFHILFVFSMFHILFALFGNGSVGNIMKKQNGELSRLQLNLQ